MKWFKRLFGIRFRTKGEISTNADSYVSVSKDGALIFDSRALLESGKMDEQLQAARDLAKSHGVEMVSYK